MTERTDADSGGPGQRPPPRGGGRVKPQRMRDHFAQIASVYRSVRTTDEAPIRFIRDALAGRDRIEAADIGCGAGRYDLLLFRHLPGLRLSCIDVNAEMLAQLGQLLTAEGIRDFDTVLSSVEDLAIEDTSLDCLFTFNAVHHFDLKSFLSKAARAVRPKGEVFVYTRLPEQNARSIWGRYFPGFRERETRLLSLQDFEDKVAQTPGLELIATKAFRYRRRSSLDRLLEQAHRKHYSTFSLYGEAEFAEACAAFERNVRRRFRNPERVTWRDENIMLRIGRGAP